MSVKESLLVALLCITIVMLALACLFILIKLFSFILAATEKKQEKNGKTVSQTSSIAENTIVKDDISSGDMRLYHVDERTAAMIMAIVSDETGIPLSELCFKSIKAIENKNNDETEARS